MRLVFLLMLFLASCQFQHASPIPDDSDRSSIIGGENVVADEFPFAVNIWYNSPKDDYVAHLCGASLIDKKWVLTAAHCVLEDESESSMRVVKPAKLNLYLGGLQHSGADGRLLKIKSISVHPEFSWPKHDVALIELSETVNDVPVVDLNSVDLGESSEDVTVVGWGLQDAAGKSESEFLQKITRPLVPRATCAQDPFPRSKEIAVGADTLCIQSAQNSKTSCPGDSGGPLLKKIAGRWVQVGVVSWGSACGGNRSLNSSNVSGYSDVSNALPWIRQQTGLSF